MSSDECLLVSPLTQHASLCVEAVDFAAAVLKKNLMLHPMRYVLRSSIITVPVWLSSWRSAAPYHGA